MGMVVRLVLVPGVRMCRCVRMLLRLVLRLGVRMGCRWVGFVRGRMGWWDLDEVRGIIWMNLGLRNAGPPRSSGCRLW